MKRNHYKRLIILFLFTSFYFQNETFSEFPPFQLEKISTDFNGVVYNGTNILAYGKYGIITYSSDNGKSWQQFSLGEKLNILRIIVIGKTFYALTPYSILKSTDNGLNWLQKKIFDLPIIKDFTTDSTFLFFISENTIYRFDTSFSTEPEIITQFEFASLSEIVYLNNHLFCIEQNYYIYRVNLLTFEVNIIDIHSSILSGIKEVRDISHIKVFDSKLYLLVESAYQNSPNYTKVGVADYNIRHYLLKSVDLGKNWETVTINIRLTKEYQIVNDTIFYLTQKGILDPRTYNYFYTVKFFLINSEGEEEEITEEENLERMIPAFTGENNDYNVQNTFRINSLLFIDKQTIIGVGPNKTILKSTNGGKSWKLISYFRPLSDDKVVVKFMGKNNDTIIVLTKYRPYYYISFDKGATFLPPRFNVENFPERVDYHCAFDDGTFTFIQRQIFFHTEINDNKYKVIFDSTQFHIYTSLNFGDSFSKSIFSRLNIYFSDSIRYNVVKCKVINEKLMIIFGGYSIKEIETIPNSYIYFFNKFMNPIDSITLEKTPLSEFSNLLFNDTILFLVDDSLFLKKSKDFGRSWDNILKLSYGNNSLELFHRGYLLIQNSRPIDQHKFSYKLFTLNIENLLLDSVEFHSLPMNFFLYNDTLLSWNSSTNKLYFFPLGIQNIKIYDSIEITNLFDDFVSIINFATKSNEAFYLHLLTEVGSVAGFNKIYELNLAKISYNKQSYLTIKPNRKDNWTYINFSNPFPMPVKDKLFILINVGSKFEFSKIEVKIHDILGKVYTKEGEIHFYEDNTYLLTFDCFEMNSGIYVASIKLSNQSFNFPFVVQR